MHSRRWWRIGSERNSRSRAEQSGGVAWIVVSSPAPPSDPEERPADEHLEARDVHFGYRDDLDVLRKSLEELGNDEVGVRVLHAAVGGITESRRIAWMAEEHGVRFVPHGWNTAIGVTADMHLVAALPVGAQRQIRSFALRYIETRRTTRNVLPHPGPPVTMPTCDPDAPSAAATWSSCRPASWPSPRCSFLRST